ncbi:hypothetical protein SPSYN_00578 [Sporotomaculum syntrophicum]|uniref:Uncharacterized protein n=1 Tax=Sporotomaculum syntrophicum TaxID=182264 RepID=A0A9D2WR53_9FIRM|nr:hypothetical protein [Sporotomaculum syntrophicum]KAF1085849.1 hypothetical protein SPSYN_00578 [Sporotomaculum syntrophicum]
MPGDDLKKRMNEFLEIKDKYNLDNEKFLLFMSLINLIGIVNLLEMRAEGGVQGSSTSRSQDMVPFLGMFGGHKGRVPTDGTQK